MVKDKSITANCNADFRVEDGVLKSYEGFDADIFIPESINGETVREIGKKAFSHREDIRTVIIPDTVRVIQEGAFAFSGLVQVLLGKGVESIEKEAFMGTDLEYLSVPESVKKVGENALDCLGLRLSDKGMEIGLKGCLEGFSEEAFGISKYDSSCGFSKYSRVISREEDHDKASKMFSGVIKVFNWEW